MASQSLSEVSCGVCVPLGAARLSVVPPQPWGAACARSDTLGPLLWWAVCFGSFPSIGQHLLGMLLMGSTWVPVVERRKDHSGEMALLPDLCEFPCAFMAAHKMDHLS